MAHVNTPQGVHLNQLLAPVCTIARQAGEKILAIYNQADTDFNIAHKTDSSPLTAADLASHHHLVAALHDLEPHYPVLSEESATLPFTERAQWETYWLVDPLDGTKEFIKRNGEFSVLIALIHQHRPVLGVIHAPVLNTTWYAALQQGAYRQQGTNTPTRLHTREPGEVLTVVGSRSHAGESLQQFLESIGPHTLVSMGSILKACMVAEGQADIYPRLGPTSEWDTAAAQILVEEAGGQLVRTDDMQPLRYNRQESLLNPEFIVYGRNTRPWQNFLD